LAEVFHGKLMWRDVDGKVLLGIELLEGRWGKNLGRGLIDSVLCANE